MLWIIGRKSVKDHSVEGGGVKFSWLHYTDNVQLLYMFIFCKKRPAKLTAHYECLIRNKCLWCSQWSWRLPVFSSRDWSTEQRYRAWQMYNMAQLCNVY